MSGQNGKAKLRLYVARSTDSAARALDELRSVCSSDLGGAYEVEVIDVVQRPALADGERIYGVSAFLNHLPQRIHSILYRLTHEEKVLLGLDLSQTESA